MAEVIMKAPASPMCSLRALGAKSCLVLTASIVIILFTGERSPAQVTDPALVSAAVQEGRGVVYTGGTPASAERLVKSFAKNFGVRLDTVRASSGPLTQRFHIEWETDNNQA